MTSTKHTEFEFYQNNCKLPTESHQLVYLISSNWWETWIKFTESKMKKANKPGVIDNSSLVTTEGKLRSSLSPDEYKIVTKEFWEYIDQLYSSKPELSFYTSYTQDTYKSSYVQLYPRVVPVCNPKNEKQKKINIELYDHLTEKEIEKVITKDLGNKLIQKSQIIYLSRDDKKKLLPLDFPQNQLLGEIVNQLVGIVILKKKLNNKEVIEFINKPKITELFEKNEKNNYISRKDLTKIFGATKELDLFLDIKPKNNGESKKKNDKLNLRSLRRYNLRATSSPQKNLQNLKIIPPYPSFVGIINLGNKCYMNASLQCLFQTNHLVQYFLSSGHYKEINYSNILGCEGQLATSFGDFIKKYWESNNQIIQPDEFLTTFTNFFPHFHNLSQQDAQEFLVCFLNGMHEDLKRLPEKTKTENTKVIESDEENSIIYDLFHGRSKSLLTCEKCGQLSKKFESFLHLSLALPKKQFLNHKMTLVRRDRSNKTTKYFISSNRWNGLTGVIKSVKENANLTDEKIMICQIENGRIKTRFTKKNQELLMSKQLKNLYAYEFKSNNIYELENDFNYIEIISNFDNGNLKFPSLLKMKNGNYSYNDISFAILLHFYGRLKNLDTLNLKAESKIDEFETVIKSKSKIVFSSSSSSLEGGLVNENNGDRKSIDEGDNNLKNRKRKPCNLPDRSNKMKQKKNNQGSFIKNKERNDEDSSGSDDSDDSEDLEYSEGNENDNFDYNFFFEILEIQNGNEIEKIDPKQKKSREKLFTIKPEANTKIVIQWNKKITNSIIKKSDLEEVIKHPNIKMVKDNSFSFNNSITIEQCISNYVKEEKLSKDDRWNCPKCKEQVTATKKIIFNKMPQILIIHLKRWEKLAKLTKNETFVHFSQFLDLQKYVEDPQQRCLYRLYAVINHYGRYTDGHYTSVVRNLKNDRFCSYNDIEVEEINNLRNVKTRHAYILFYLKLDN
ncbi:ubiquitin carboxyl-terminal hydrolase [Anaeramoeba flamelloides]|uniref:Ubiquitin carboxyl-terminal hydrolase n=1 Tax=Anaeramoeba flamelloides TaxID=1746091 RepID=A0AAV8A783_9EUKA|nr:ubiquitin carboxyl-terminal hydrolase [Anaeramoeba flamelloides]